MSDASNDGLLALCGSMMILSMVAVGLRFWARKQQKVPLMADDWTAVVALWSMTRGWATPIIILERTEQKECSARSSSTRRIFCNSGKLTIFSTLTWITIIILVLWLLVFEFLAGFVCGTDYSKVVVGSFSHVCSIALPSSLGLAISDILLDVWILALPILETRVANLTRCIWIKLLTQMVFYGRLECGMAIIAVNLPSLRVLAVSPKMSELLGKIRRMFKPSFLPDSSSEVAPNSLVARNADGIESIESFSTGPRLPPGST
ncbi:hypothetical protein PG994_014417 [Apiospora phragmitis]|uniref:Uncharacterized protein n=1 Tax=Apiospora phragmitis TaxID=2905665 RepID=A0ABR1T489_9PEZI